MSTNHNRRRGAKANKSRPVRTCKRVMGEGTTHYYCGAAVAPNLNGNRCEEHRQ